MYIVINLLFIIMTLSRKTKLILLIILIIIVLGVSIGLISYLTNKTTPLPGPQPWPTPGPTLAPTKPATPTQCEPESPILFSIWANGDVNWTNTDITSNSTSVSYIDFTLYYYYIYTICDDNLKANAFKNDSNNWNTFINNKCGFKIKFSDNNYPEYNITKIDVKNSTITFDAPPNFYLSGSKAWPILLQVTPNENPVEVVNV